MFSKCSRLLFEWFLSGDCPWKGPEVQRRKVCPWTVCRLIFRKICSWYDKTKLKCLRWVYCWWDRFKVSGPDGSNYWITPEAHVGGSDADDAWLTFISKCTFLEPLLFLFDSWILELAISHLSGFPGLPSLPQ